jgi:hypothetical protein
MVTKFYDWNNSNPQCTQLVGKGKFYYGTKLCSCANSQLGPNLNIMPSATIRNNLKEFKEDEGYLKKNGILPEDIVFNPYSLTDMNSFTKDNDATIYSMDINGLDFNQIFPQSLDATCAVNVATGAYNLKEESRK